jgi:hypothetical protein
MKVLVCGGREFDDYGRLCDVLDKVCGWSTDFITIINGGARGADRLSSRYAREYGCEVIEVPADWATHGRAAGPLRNQAMLDIHKPDQGVVFPGGRGTEDMLLRLFRAKVNTWVVSP